MMFANELVTEMRNAKYGNRSYTKQYLAMVLEQNKEQEVAEAVVEVIAFGISNALPLTAICRKIANKMYRIMDIEDEKNDRQTIRLGADACDWAAKAGLVKAEKFAVIDNDGQEQYFLVCDNDDFHNHILENTTGSLRANNGITPWTSPVLRVGDHRLDIVKNARRYGLLSNYRHSEMPEVYSALNRLNDTPWVINKEVLKLLSSSLTAPNAVVPSEVPEEARKAALAQINKADRTALWISEIKFKQLVEKGYEEEKAEKFAEIEAKTFKLVKQFDHKEIISDWSKRMDFERCIRLATEYGDDVLNFIYNCDSRGRVYALQHGLNPQGADFAKALLQFAAPKPISTFDFYVTMANHAGQDKKSYDDRVKWVQDNAEMVYLVGSDAFSEESIQWLTETGIIREAKSKFQFIAAAMEYKRLIDFLEAGGDQDDFLCVIPVAYDATNSGLQILSAIGRDEVVAPLVNITSTPKPGDVYQYIGNYVAQDCPVESLNVFESGEKIWRKICKRNVMTKAYAATRIGMGEQQWEDRKSYGSDITDKLTVQECRTLGAKVYDVCGERLEKASALMETMRKAISKTDKSIVEWKLPTGFTAFQVKDRSKKEQVDVRIGNIDRIQLAFYTFTGVPNRSKHQNAIAPDMVHSIDAWLLMSIVNDLPTDANLAFVHDQYGSDSIHGGDIQDVAKDNYVHVTSRTVFKLLLEQVNGDEVELPEAGTWCPTELKTAEYVVC